jgi:hypothetical protein
MPLREKPEPYQAPAFGCGPGSAAHRFAKSHSASKTRVNAFMALRCVWGTNSLTE